MLEREKSIARIVRNTVAAAVVVATPSMALNITPAEPANAYRIQIQDSRDQVEDLSFFEQADEFMETDTGKSIAGLLLVATALNMISTLHHSSKLDNREKYIQAIGSSSMMLGLSAVALASAFTEIDPRIPASVFQAQLGFQTLYTLIDENQRWHGVWATPRVGAAIAFFGVGTALLVDSFK